MRLARYALCFAALCLSGWACRGEKPEVAAQGAAVNGFTDDDTIRISAEGNSSDFTGKGSRSEAGAIASAAMKLQKPFSEICLDRDDSRDAKSCATISVVCGGERKFVTDYVALRSSVKVSTVEKTCQPPDSTGNIRCRIVREFKRPGLKAECIRLRPEYSPCCDHI